MTLLRIYYVYFQHLQPTEESLRKLSAFLTGLLLSTIAGSAFADIEVRKDGSSWARIEDDGTIRIGGSSVGRIEHDGTVRKNGSSVGRVESDGTIRENGSSVGRVESDGTMRKNGSSIGRIENDGGIRKNGSSWGHASSCCGDFGSKRTVAALLVFFSNYF